MNLGKVKNFLIILFLGINIYLIASNFVSTRFYEDEATVADCIDVLKVNGVELDEDIVPDYTVNLKGIDTENVVYTNINVHTGKNGFKTKGNNFSCVITPKNKNAKPQKAVMDFLEENGFETEHMKFSESDKDDVWYITCKVSDYTIFDSRIKVTKSSDSYIINGKWYEPKSHSVRSSSRQRNTVYITSVLVDMIANEDIMANAPFKIEDIDYGYLAGLPYGVEDHVSVTAVPYYRIKDSKGNTYYYDARSGEYLK